MLGGCIIAPVVYRCMDLTVVSKSIQRLSLSATKHDVAFDRGLAWTPDSAADVAKLRGGVAATPSSASYNTACHGIGGTGGSGKLPTPTFNLAVDDKENLRLNMADACRSSPAGVPSCHNNQKGTAPRIKFMTPLLQRYHLHFIYARLT